MCLTKAFRIIFVIDLLKILINNNAIFYFCILLLLKSGKHNQSTQTSFSKNDVPI